MIPSKSFRRGSPRLGDYLLVRFGKQAVSLGKTAVVRTAWLRLRGTAEGVRRHTASAHAKPSFLLTL